MELTAILEEVPRVITSPSASSIGSLKFLDPEFEWRIA